MNSWVGMTLSSSRTCPSIADATRVDDLVERLAVGPDTAVETILATAGDRLNDDRVLDRLKDAAERFLTLDR